MNLNVDKFKVFGDTEIMQCPKCQQLVNMKILKSSSGLGLLGVKLYEYQIELFTICPKCGSVYSVDKKVSEKAGREDSNMFNSITEANLTYQTGLNYNA